jgi:signal transduction histidine kinase
MESIGPGPARSAATHLRRALVGPDHRPAARPPSRRRTVSRWYTVPVALLALTGLGFAAAEYLQNERDMSTIVAALLAVTTVLPVALAPRFPLLAWRIGYVALFLGVLGAHRNEPWPWNPVQLGAYLFVLVTVAVREESGVTGWVAVLSLIPVFAFVADENAYGVVALLAVMMFVAERIGRRRQARRSLAERQELSRVEQARRAILEERARIAREMHDVVAHHMSMIAVQAETAPYRLGDLPEPARAELAAIAVAARAALTDMRRLLGVLRSDTDDTPLAPQPGLDDLPELVATARRAGMPVQVDVRADAVNVPGAAGLAAYRIVQEALANAARHAPGGPVRLVIRAGGDRLDVMVHSGPPTGQAPPATAGTGHGLVGMRERATLLGGTLTAGPDDTGDGYTVTASLPCGDQEQA